MFLRFLIATIIALQIGSSALAQVAEKAADPFRTYGETVITKYRVGVSVDAAKGPVQDVFAMMAIPFECDEQEVIVADEDISAEVDSVKYRTLQDGATQMLITIPYLPGNTVAKAILTFEVRTKAILPPDDEFTAQLVPPKKPDRDLKRFLGRSKYIQSNHGKIRRELKAIFDEKPKSDESETKDEPTDDDVELTSLESTESDDDAEKPTAELNTWQRVEKIYDHVQKSIEYVEGNDQNAVQTLDRKKGDCHDVSALFVALCRASKIPARMVWVHEHQYAEFCLEDAKGELHWFPIESSGTRAFGEMPLARVIMQKGDNFRIPERPGESFRYASEFLIGSPVDGSGKPKVRYIREKL